MRGHGHFDDADVTDVATLALTGLAHQPAARGRRSRGRVRGVVNAENTNFGRYGRRFHRYPNRRVASSAWQLNRQGSRRGYVGNPITNEVQLLI
jgi:hypothetical protein